jgi:hypothetical protein
LQGQLQTASRSVLASNTTGGNETETDYESAPSGASSNPPRPPPPPPPAGRTIEPPPPPDVKRVSTAIELQEAVQAGFRDIEVIDHLDLRDLQLLSAPREVVAERHTMYVANSTRSIRVRIVQLQNCYSLQRRQPTSSPVLAAKKAQQGSSKV